MSRPKIVIPGRYAQKATYIRRTALALAERLMDCVYRAGGEPVMIYPSATEDINTRFAWVDGLLLPGGGDVDPAIYGQARHESIDGDNAAQDAFDIALTKWALENGVPTLAICRGFHVVNVALGGTLEQDMEQPHRRYVHELKVTGAVAEITGEQITASCFHHQRLQRPADGLRVLSQDDDGTIEAADLPSASGWFLGVQWHPEDTGAEDDQQAAIFRGLVSAAEERARRPRLPSA